MENQISAKRFRQIREEQGLTQQAFAEMLDIGATTADIERGRTKLSGQVVAELLRLFAINPLWLFGQSLQKHLPSHQGDVSPKVISLDSASKENMLLVNTKASAGYPSNLQDPEWYAKLPAFDFPLPEFRHATHRAFQVHGDSMQPALHSGEWVVGKAVESLKEVKWGAIYVVISSDSVLVKKLSRVQEGLPLQLISLNTDYPSISLLVEEVRELWKVVARISFHPSLEKSELSHLSQQLEQGFSQLRQEIQRLKT